MARAVPAAAGAIGVFDSGIGGLSILRALRAALPHEDFVYIADAGHAPYGERGDAFVAQRAHAVAQVLVDTHHAKLLVVACNTATAAAVHGLRQAYPDLPIVGVEPALKPALAHTHSRCVGVMATRTTLGSAKFAALLDALDGQARFILQPCDGLAEAIEQDDEPRTRALCGAYLQALGIPADGAPGSAGGVDTVVLGCTHYPLALDTLQAIAGAGVVFVEPGDAIARRVKALLDTHGLANPEGAGRLALSSTGDPAPLWAAATRWLGLEKLGSDPN